LEEFENMLNYNSDFAVFKQNDKRYQSVIKNVYNYDDLLMIKTGKNTEKLENLNEIISQFEKGFNKLKDNLLINLVLQ